MGSKGQAPHNKRTDIDVERLVREYRHDRGAVRRLASEWGCSIVTLYNRLDAAGVDRREPGDASTGTQACKNNPNWGGGRHLDAAGYVVVRVSDASYRREHCVVAEGALGRPLHGKEVVHHRNGDRADNRPENLEVLASQSEHMKLHMNSEEARRRGLLTKRGLAALKAVEE